MKKYILIVISYFVFITMPLAQDMIASINKNQVALGEPIVLVLSLDKQSSESPQLEPLEKDFKVISVANAYNTQIVNGLVSQSLEYRITMLPKIEGKIIIPALVLGNLSSNPITIEVLSADNIPEVKNSNVANFKLEGKLDNFNPYLQQQINYSVFLYDGGGLEGGEPRFRDNSDWIIKSLGQPRIEVMVKDGKRVREIRFDYALFAQKSGRLIIPAFEFEGYTLHKNNQRNNPFEDLFGGSMMLDVFATKAPVFLKTKAIEIDVKSAVDEAKGQWWLPAKNVEIFAKMLNDDSRYEVGKPIKREIYLQAKGIIDSQLPEINFPSSLNLRQYPQKPVLQNLVENDLVVALKKVEHSYIPTSGGEVVLPEIAINWFDVDNQKMQKAVLPEQKINVMGAVVKKTHKLPEVQTKNDAEIKTDANIVVYFTAVFAFIFGVLIAWSFMKRNRKKNYFKQVLIDAKNYDLKALQVSLLEWGKDFYKSDKMHNLKDLAIVSKSKAFEVEVEKLFAELYSNSSGKWNHRDFSKAFKNIAKKRNLFKNREILPKLYK